MVTDSKFLYSARVENKTPTPLTVVATYSQTLNPDTTQDLVQTIHPHGSVTFGPRHMSESQMFISRFEIFDNDKNQRAFEGPFVDRSKDRIHFEIQRLEKDDFTLVKRQ